MKYVFSSHARPARPLWKAIVYESLRLVSAVVMVTAVVITLKGGV